MEIPISNLCKTLASACNHIDASSKALSDAIQRPPIPLNAAASTFLKSLDQRMASAGEDLNLLDSMTNSTVSFEELHGHLKEFNRVNGNYIAAIEEKMRSLGYVPEMGINDEDEEDISLDPQTLSRNPTSEELEDEQLFEDSSLLNLGLSDSCLAVLASGDEDYPQSLMISSHNIASLGDAGHEKSASFQLPKHDMNVPVGHATQIMINTSKGDYDSLPSYIKSLASWEELQVAVAKINDYFCNNEAGSNSFNEAQIETLGLGHKGRSHLLLLVRMKKLIVETISGSMAYRAHV